MRAGGFVKSIVVVGIGNSRVGCCVAFLLLLTGRFSAHFFFLNVSLLPAAWELINTVENGGSGLDEDSNDD